MPAEYTDRDIRVERIEEQGLEGIWLFPTAGILYEQALGNDIEALCATCEGFNRWLEEDWGFSYQNKLFAAPYISLAYARPAAPRSDPIARVTDPSRAGELGGR